MKNIFKVSFHRGSQAAVASQVAAGGVCEAAEESCRAAEEVPGGGCSKRGECGGKLCIQAVEDYF